MTNLHDNLVSVHIRMIILDMPYNHSNEEKSHEGSRAACVCGLWERVTKKDY